MRSVRLFSPAVPSCFARFVPMSGRYTSSMSRLRTKLESTFGCWVAPQTDKAYAVIHYLLEGQPPDDDHMGQGSVFGIPALSSDVLSLGSWNGLADEDNTAGIAARLAAVDLASIKRRLRQVPGDVYNADWAAEDGRYDDILVSDALSLREFIQSCATRRLGLLALI